MSQTNTKAQTQDLLPQDPREALEYITKLTLELCDVMQAEANAMVLRDGIALTALEKDKEVLSRQYEEVAASFRLRLNQFRRQDTNMLDKLEAAQLELGAITRRNVSSLEVKHVQTAIAQG